MANLRRSGFRTTRPQRRKTSWNVGPETGVNGARQAITSSVAVIAQTSVDVVAEGITLVRTRGEVNLMLEIAAADHDGFHGAMGIAVATKAAITAGASAVPTPLTEESWDGWLWHRYFSLFAGGTIAAATATQQADQVNATCAALRVEIDSRAMRKLSVDMTLYAAVEVVELGSAEMSWALNSRMLVKLP